MSLLISVSKIAENCSAKHLAISKKPILIGEFVPECDKDGNYNAMQCWASTGSCWCVDKFTGEKVDHLHDDKDGRPICGKKYFC